MVFKVQSLIFGPEENPKFFLPGVKKFTLRELKSATNNFSHQNIIGRGGFGEVYKGFLFDGSVVAIKRRVKDAAGGDEQFQKEVDFAGAAVHPNLCRLIGSCMTKMEQLLVYPFMGNGSVASYLRENHGHGRWLDWKIRKKIALGVAKAISHLHYNCGFKIIHRDVKAANVLLDEKFNALLTDFGLAKFLPVRRSAQERTIKRRPGSYRVSHGVSCWYWRRKDEGNSDNSIDFPGKYSGQGVTCCKWSKTESPEPSPEHVRVGQSKNKAKSDGSGDDPETEVTTLLRGTVGHIAPEYAGAGKCSAKTDVFAYGIMVLELITAQRAFDLHREENDHHVLLLDWVKGLLKVNDLEKLVDPNLPGTSRAMAAEVEELIQLALMCTQKSPELRPTMSEVVGMLMNGDQLAERWEKCKELIVEESCGNPSYDGWVTAPNSSTHLHPEELSGPR